MCMEFPRLLTSDQVGEFNGRLHSEHPLNVWATEVKIIAQQFVYLHHLEGLHMVESIFITNIGNHFGTVKKIQ